MNSPLDFKRAIEQLPHGEPFRFLTAVTALTRDGGEGIWRVTGDEAFFAGHFPGEPVVPGVLLTEAAAQLAGVVGAVRSGASARGMLVLSNMRFRQHVTPPAELVVKVSGDRVMGSIHLFDVSVSLNGDVCAEGDVGLSLGQPS